MTYWVGITVFALSGLMVSQSRSGDQIFPVFISGIGIGIIVGGLIK